MQVQDIMTPHFDCVIQDAPISLVINATISRAL